MAKMSCWRNSKTLPDAGSLRPGSSPVVVPALSSLSFSLPKRCGQQWRFRPRVRCQSTSQADEHQWQQPLDISKAPCKGFETTSLQSTLVQGESQERDGMDRRTSTGDRLKESALARFKELRSHLYPPIDTTYPGLEMIHEEPPVFVVRGLLSPEDCDQLVESAADGGLVNVPCGDGVMIKYSRLWPLVFPVSLSAAPDVMKGYRQGLELGELFGRALEVMGLWSLLVLLLLAGVRWGMEAAIQGKVFTGTKWRTDEVSEGEPAWRPYQRFVQKASQLLQTSSLRLEQPTVVHYKAGEFQRVHTDARFTSGPGGKDESLRAAGQRLAQLLVYLNTMAPAQGGGTRFHDQVFKGLTVVPEKGKALVFFPAFRGGQVDFRLAHSGEVVNAGEKWIVNTWACERPVPRSF